MSPPVPTPSDGARRRRFGLASAMAVAAFAAQGCQPEPLHLERWQTYQTADLAAVTLLPQETRSPEAVAPCPPEMAKVARSCVDRFEAHLLTLAVDGSRELFPHYKRPEEGVYYEAHSRAGAMPQAYISRVESTRACNAVGKRLCRFGEWRRACRGRSWWRYPYGGHGRLGVCNISKKHLLFEMFGKVSWKYDEHFNNPELNQTPGFLAPSGEYAACKTKDDIHDMAGNLHEWVSSSVTEEFVERLEEEPVERLDQPWVDGNGMFLGGFYSTTDQHGPGCFYTTIAHEPRYHDYSIGFRCCRDVLRPPKEKKKKRR